MLGDAPQKIGVPALPNCASQLYINITKIIQEYRYYEKNILLRALTLAGAVDWPKTDDLSRLDGFELNESIKVYTTGPRHSANTPISFDTANS